LTKSLLPKYVPPGWNIDKYPIKTIAELREFERMYPPGSIYGYPAQQNGLKSGYGTINPNPLPQFSQQNMSGTLGLKTDRTNWTWADWTKWGVDLGYSIVEIYRMYQGEPKGAPSSKDVNPMPDPFDPSNVVESKDLPYGNTILIIFGLCGALVLMKVVK